MRIRRLSLPALLCGPLLAMAGRAQEPVAFLHAHEVVLFQGDSITDGGRWREGQDFNHIMGQDYAYMIAGKIGAEHPELAVTFLNRGIGGDRVVNLIGRWQGDALALKPDLLSILVGINDTLFAGTQGETAAEFEGNYDHLLAETLAALPHVRIVLGEPFLLPVGLHKTVYGTELAEVRKRAAAVQRLADKYHLPVVPYQAAFDRARRNTPAEHWSWDGVHPTYAGHWLMMQTWLKTVGSFWPESPETRSIP